MTPTNPNTKTPPIVRRQGGGARIDVDENTAAAPLRVLRDVQNLIGGGAKSKRIVFAGRSLLLNQAAVAIMAARLREEGYEVVLHIPRGESPETINPIMTDQFDSVEETDTP